jgi:hypothetical protein
MEGSIHDWFAAFYATSDDGNAHQKYATFFTPDARLIMGDKTAVGQAGKLCLLSLSSSLRREQRHL